MRLLVFILTAAIGFTTTAYAKKASETQLKESLTKLIPQSKVVKKDGDEYEVMTPKNTVVEVELNRDGTVDKASGDAAVGGDTFVPGSGMISLADAVESLKKSGKSAAGDWSYKKSFTNGWVYEFEGLENGKEMEYQVSAKDGSLVKDRRDIL